MRYFMIVAASTVLIAAAGPVFAGPFSPAGLAHAEGGANVILVRDKPKEGESLTKKVKRAWRNLVGYHFDVSCPLHGQSTCADTGKDRGEAQAKCISRNPLCWVSEKK